MAVVPIFFFCVFLGRLISSYNVFKEFSVVHGEFGEIVFPSGISSVVFTNLPPHSSFAIIQLHSPFNPLLASIVPSFDFGMSQRSEHCGLVSKLSEPHSNITLYIYSNYENPLVAWVRVDAFSSEYPVPGGCGHYTSDSFASAFISHEVMLLPWNLRIKDESYETLRYWTTVIKFDASALPQLMTIKESCDGVHTVPSNALRYHLYSTPLVTAGGDYGSFVNPTVQQVAAILRPMTPNDTHFGTLVRTFTVE
ncbi:hypothetical protein EG68_08772 [Paragonimus skrjabini miyazakii]|uniref:Uncharacterized protein n=1 Tax=Paragonimus skrjabini miyazakii TaxID=59628 RepID=A0A8S9YK42_9TREM|nr:hypothetical protein EG68_08772 [Paragonimus skrjabini miyazakii]